MTMARIITAGSIAMAFLVACAPKQSARQPPTGQSSVARSAPGAAQKVPADSKLFQSPDGDFQLLYPASWQLLPSTEDLRFHARALLGFVSANVATDQLPPGTTLDSYVDKALVYFEKAMGAEVRSPIERTRLTVNGTPAVHVGFVGTMKMTGPLVLHSDILIAVVNGKGYALTCSTSNALIATWKPVFERIISSLRFASQAAPLDTNVFDSPDGDFQLQYPASWELRKNTEHVRFDAGPLVGVDSAAVGTGPLQPGTTLDALVERVIDGFKRVGAEVKASIGRTTISLHGTPAVRVAFIAAAPTEGPGDFHIDIVAAVVNDRGYTLTCTTGNGAAAAATPVCDRIIASMRLIK